MKLLIIFPVAFADWPLGLVTLSKNNKNCLPQTKFFQQTKLDLKNSKGNCLK